MKNRQSKETLKNLNLHVQIFKVKNNIKSEFFFLNY